MMRSLFSGVAGLKTHQTRMDVIGNNIANVNTTAYKSQSMVFSDLMYQTTQAASGANAATGRGGVNARQIGLGAKTAAISTAITQQGSAQSTNQGLDLMISGESFFVVNNGSENFFTRDGSFTVDGAGNLVMASTGYMVMGWQVDEATGEILVDTVSALQVMNKDNLTYPPEATTKAHVTGIVDMYDPAVNSTTGRVVTLSFFDNRGYSYTGKFSIHSLGEDGQYYVQLDDIMDENGTSLVEKYQLNSISQVASFGTAQTKESEVNGQSLVKSAMAIQDATDPTKFTFAKKYELADALTGYSNNPIIAGATGKPVVTQVKGAAIAAGATSVDVAKGDKVTVQASIELTEKVLTSAPYNLVYYKGDYYYGATPGYAADGTTIISVSGGIKLGDGTGTGNPLAPNPPAGATQGTAAGDQHNWATALSSLLSSGNSATVSKVEVKDGVVTLTCDQEFTIDEDVSSYDVTQQCFVGNEISALEAYGLTETADTTYQFVSYAVPDASKANFKKVMSYTGNALTFNVEDGEFRSIGTSGDTAALTFFSSATSSNGSTVDLSFFYNTDIDFSSISNVANGGKSTVEMTSGDGTENNLGSGRRVGEMIGMEVGQDGKITASYDNGQTKLLGQIVVANFANASGLSKEGDNLYSATMNSGEFDGIGDDISAVGEKMESGVLEMSNVDLSNEFTQMITTQRGFQANSRIITVSDTLLEELVNLKR